MKKQEVNRKAKSKLRWSVGFSALLAVSLIIIFLINPKGTAVAQESKVFPIGYYKFNKNKAYNFQMNRFHSMGYARLEDFQKVGADIKTFDDWVNAMVGLAELALSEDRILDAAYYYRAAEFFIVEGDVKKEILYNKFIHYFNEATADENIERAKIPNGESYMYTLRMKPDTDENKGTIILHGGYDSFKEEMYSVVKWFYNEGYDVITFETPWMGESRKHKELGLTIKWEDQISTILDYYELEDVTLLGFSMGGWLSLRAAAFEPRITRVIASSVSYDVNLYTGKLSQKMAEVMFTKKRDFTNKTLTKKMKKDIYYRWFVGHLMYVTNKPTPVEAFDVLRQFTAENLHSDKVKQDVLIMTGKEDHAVPFKMHQMQVDALVSARSVTDNVYTKETTGEHHCQIGNIEMSLVDMMNWMESVSSSKPID